MDVECGGCRFGHAMGGRFECDKDFPPYPCKERQSRKIMLPKKWVVRMSLLRDRLWAFRGQMKVNSDLEMDGDWTMEKLVMWIKGDGVVRECRRPEGFTEEQAKKFYEEFLHDNLRSGYRIE